MDAFFDTFGLRVKAKGLIDRNVLPVVMGGCAQVQGSAIGALYSVADDRAGAEFGLKATQTRS
jgi:hypothetical protein